jgi:hypothetical protein
VDYQELASRLLAKLAESHEHEARVAQGRKEAAAFWQQFGAALTLGIDALNKALQLEDAFIESASHPSSGKPASERSVRTGASVVDIRLVREAAKPTRIEWRIRTDGDLAVDWVPMTIIGSPRGEAWVICSGAETSASALAERVLESLVNERLRAIEASQQIDAVPPRASSVRST